MLVMMTECQLPTFLLLCPSSSHRLHPHLPPLQYQLRHCRLLLCWQPAEQPTGLLGCLIPLSGVLTISEGLADVQLTVLEKKSTTILGIPLPSTRTSTRTLCVVCATLLLHRSQMESMKCDDMRATEATVAMRMISCPARAPLLQILFTPILPILPPLQPIPDDLDLLPTDPYRRLQALRIVLERRSHGRSIDAW